MQLLIYHQDNKNYPLYRNLSDVREITVHPDNDKKTIIRFSSGSWWMANYNPEEIAQAIAMMQGLAARLGKTPLALPLTNSAARQDTVPISYILEMTSRPMNLYVLKANPQTPWVIHSMESHPVELSPNVTLGKTAQSALLPPRP